MSTLAYPLVVQERIAVLSSNVGNGSLLRRRRFPRSGDNMQRAFRLTYDPLPRSELMTVLGDYYGDGDYGAVPIDVTLPSYGVVKVRTVGPAQWAHISRNHIRLIIDLIEEPRPYA